MGAVKRKRNQQIRDILKAVKAKQRQDEIDTYGKPISHSHVVKSKKVYSRKRKNQEEW